MKTLRQFRKDETGAAMIIAALGLVAFLAIASLVTDLGLRYYQKSRLQNAMDAAALAGVTYLPDRAKAKEKALEYVQKNGISTDNVVIEFPEEGVVRVRDSVVCGTLFANIFSEKQMVIEAHAAAKFVDKNLSLDFDYLMFQSDDSTFNLNGDFREVAGSIFANGNIRVGCNDAAVIQSIVSARNVTFANQMQTAPLVTNNASHQQMPDWDEMIMSIAPVAEEEQFLLPQPPLSADGRYKYTLNGDTTLNSFISYADGSVRCTGSLSTGYTNTILYIRGNLYVEGDFMPQCPVYVTGDVYVGGQFSSVWGMNLYVGGKMYVKENVSLQGQTTIGDTLCCGGNLKLTNGNGTVYKTGSIYCKGDFTTDVAWGAKFQTKGNIFTYGKMVLGGGNHNIHGNVYVWGNRVLASTEACILQGTLELNGDVWNRKGGVVFGGNGDCTVQGYVYSGGRIETRSGGDISLNGCMIAEGDIKLGGASHTYNDSGATLSLYSRAGNIELGSQGSELRMWGIVYAPKGDIRISTDGLRIYGSLVAKTLTCNIGCGFYIGRNDRTLPFAKTIRAAALVE